MKKLWMLLVLALLVTALPTFASDVTFSGRMIWDAAYDPDGSASAGLVRFRPKLTAKVDDFNTLVAEFRMEGAWVASKGDITGGFFTDADKAANQGVKVTYAYVTTDITGALGLSLPITIKTTFGKFEPGFTDWNYVSESGWESYYDWPNMIADVGPFNTGGGQIDIGFGPATLRVFSDLQGFMMFGLSGGFGPVVGWLTYQAPASGFGDGILGVEAKYSAEFGDIKLGVPVFFRYQLNAAAGAQDYTFGAGVSGDYKMFHLAAGLEGDSAKIPDNVVFDVSVAPLDNLKLYGHVYLDMGKDAVVTAALKEPLPGGTPADINTQALAGIDLGVSYKFGAATAMLGYVIGGDDLVPLPINGDTFNVANGLYMAVDISY
jgi:hypothetical protein